MNIRRNSKILETSLTTDGILRLNLNNPDNLNALSENMIDLMQKNIERSLKISQYTWQSRSNYLLQL